MKFINRQFGELEFDEQYVVDFPKGIVGFEQHRKYVIIDDEDSEPFRWLVSIEDENLSFPLLDPSLVLPNYDRQFSLGEGKSVFVVASLNERVEKSSVNLRSPLIIDNATREGEQVILDDDSLPFQFPLVPSSTDTTPGATC
jgi:flagellar assembly factor FliW